MPGSIVNLEARSGAARRVAIPGAQAVVEGAARALEVHRLDDPTMPAEGGVADRPPGRLAT
ncbi:MAG: hypothetical protein NVS2B9_12520 [Myxococcales bacterium]